MKTKSDKAQIEKLIDEIYHCQTYGKECDDKIEKLNQLLKRPTNQIKKKNSAKKEPHEITLTLTLKEQGRNLLGFRQEWINGTYGKRKFQLLSGNGLGNPFLMFYLTDEKGKNYRYYGDVQELLKQFNERKSELQPK